MESTHLKIQTKEQKIDTPMILGFMKVDDKAGFNNFNKKIPLFADVCRKPKFQDLATPI